MEAALVFPVFLFAVLALQSLHQVMRVQETIAQGLADTGRMVSQAAVLADQSKVDLQWDGTGREILTFTGMQAFFHTCLGRDELTVRLADGGNAGIVLTGSTASLEESTKLTAVCRIRIRWPFFSPPGVITAVRCQIRGFLGDQVWKDHAADEGASEEKPDDRLVYITEYGTVYHLDPTCVYLNPKVRQMTLAQAQAARAADGSKYYPCELCYQENGGMVYITSDGNRYHSSRECPGLKRTIRQVWLSTLKGWKACSRCGS